MCDYLLTIKMEITKEQAKEQYNKLVEDRMKTRGLSRLEAAFQINLYLKKQMKDQNKENVTKPNTENEKL